MSGIYIHVPFCKQACTYCDFYFETSRKHRAGFVQALKQEMAWEAAHTGRLQEEIVETVYLGGGTPSVLTPAEIHDILETLRSLARISGTAEITMEMNPDDVQPHRLSELMAAGINRFSMGVQTFNEERLRFMNRAHSRQEALTALSALAASGCRSWTADLIYGNPGQPETDLLEDVETMLRFNPPHVSAYSLTVEPRTRLGSMVRKKLVRPAEDDLVSRHMNLIMQRFRQAGLERYETSNYAWPGHESRHNGAYWQHINYLGLGPSAHSFWWETGDGSRAPSAGLRWRNLPKLGDYITQDYDADGEPEFREEAERLSLHELAEERLLIGLRTRPGVGIGELMQRYGYRFSASQRQFLIRMQEQGYIIIQACEPAGNTSPAADREPLSAAAAITLSETGMMMADYLALELISRG